MRLEGAEEVDEVSLLLRVEAQAEAGVVEVDDLGEVGGGAVVEVGCAGGETAKAGDLDAVDVGAEAGEEAGAGVGRGEGDGIASGIFAAGDLVDGEAGDANLGEAGEDVVVGFSGGETSGGDGGAVGSVDGCEEGVGAPGRAEEGEDAVVLRLMPWAGWWQVAQVRPLVPRAVKRGEVWSMRPAVV